MLAGNRVAYSGDSTTFVGYDVGDPVPSVTDSFISLLEANQNLTVHNMASPGVKASFQYSNGVFCGLRANASAIHSFIRGLGIDFSVYVIGVNDWKNQPEGVDRYINAMKAILNNDIAVGTTKICVCRPFRQYYSGDEPVNELGETLSSYGTALSTLVDQIKALNRSVDIRYCDTTNWITNSQSYYLEDGYHIRANAHAQVHTNFVSTWQGWGWI